MDGITPTIRFQFNAPGALEADLARARAVLAAHFTAAEVHPLDALLAAFEHEHSADHEPVIQERAQVWHSGRSIALQSCYPGNRVPPAAGFWIDWAGGPIAR